MFGISKRSLLHEIRELKQRVKEAESNIARLQIQVSCQHTRLVWHDYAYHDPVAQCKECYLKLPHLTREDVLKNELELKQKEMRMTQNRINEINDKLQDK